MRTITATTATAAFEDKQLKCDCTSNAITIKLPDARMGANFAINIKKTDTTANAVTILPNGTDTIDGALTYSLTKQNEYITIASIDGGWSIIDKDLSLMGEGTVIPATTGTVTVTMDSTVKKLTPTGAITLNASGGSKGQMCTLVVLSSGVSSYVITFGTGFKTTGTLATGTTDAKTFSVSFVHDGTNWVEKGRTAAM